MSAGCVFHCDARRRPCRVGADTNDRDPRAAAHAQHLLVTGRYIRRHHAVDRLHVPGVRYAGAYESRPEFVLGPNLDIALLNFLTHLKTNNPERSKYLTFRIGYRYAKNLYKRDTSAKNGVLELTPRVPLPWGFQVSDRNRIDLQGLPTRFNWNYRNRVALLRSIPVGKFAITPYAEAEAFYNCSFGEWSQYTYQFGAISRITPKIEIDAWYRRRTSLTEPVVRANLTGVKLLLFFHSVK